jgi:simple sugar transport system permease protein
MIKQITRSNEFMIAASIVVLSIVMTFVNPAYLTLANLFDMLRNATVYGILALACLIVMISGGVDVSFVAIASASSYITMTFLINRGFQGSALVAYLIALPIGVLLGCINAFFVARFKLPTFVVTLGTYSMYYGFVLFFVGSGYLYELPDGMSTYAKMRLLTVKGAGVGTASLHPSVLIFFGSAILVWAFLKYTMIGRGIYAIGGARDVAERTGFNIPLIQFVMFGLAGALSSIGGITQVALYRNGNPAALMGNELDVIAAVVLGGASITGGRGTVIGSFLGLMLIVILKSCLILSGISAEWQRFVIGIALIIGTSVPAIRSARLRNRPGKVAA